MDAENSNRHLFDFETAKTLRFRSWRRSIYVGLFFGVMWGGIAIGVIWTLYSRIDPPTLVLNSTMLSRVVEEGDPLSFLVTAATQVDRTCLGSITREYYQPVDHQGEMILRKKRDMAGAPIVDMAGVVHYRDLEDNVREVKTSPYIVDIDMPPTVRPGFWLFRGETTYDCGFVWAFIKDFPRSLKNGGVMRLRTPFMAFQVVAKKSLGGK